uniref:Transmembrane protein 184C n=1 Tax=Lygus hesperus TaxID=30085 RepID=A0A0A9VVG3_LYGHE
MSELTCQCRRYFIVIYVFLLIVVLPALIIVSIKEEINKNEKTVLLGGVFVVIALPISIWEIIQHMIYYSRPSLQKYIIRILWMVPIYALNGWLGLVYPEKGIYVDSGRECYEAYVIYNFLMYLLNYLNEEMDLEINLALKPQVKHSFPLCWIPNWKMGRELVYKCKHGILQYTLLRTMTTVISFICALKGVYGEGEFKPTVAFPYIIAINNVSQFMAMYCLVLFYRANKEELRSMKPIGKFLCIKAVVFFSFFQGVLIKLAAYYGFLNFLDESPTPSEESINALSNKIQNFLICIEMFLAAIAHHYCFSHDPYVNDLVEKRTLCDAFIAMWDVSDIQADLKDHIGAIGSSLSNINRKLRSQSSQDGETSALISPSSSDAPMYNSVDT